MGPSGTPLFTDRISASVPVVTRATLRLLPGRMPVLLVSRIPDVSTLEYASRRRARVHGLAAIRKRLGHMDMRYISALIKIGDRAGEPERPVIPSGRHAEVLCCVLQQAQAFACGNNKLAKPAGRAIAIRAGAREAELRVPAFLQIACASHTIAHHGARFGRARLGQIERADGRHVDLQIDPVEHWP